MNEDPSTPIPDDEAEPEVAVTIEIPAELRYVSLTRVAAASLAAELDPVIDDIEDLRVAVNELVGLLVEAATAGPVRLRMWCEQRTIHVTGRCTSSVAAVVPDPIAERILAATVLSVEQMRDALSASGLAGAVESLGSLQDVLGRLGGR